MVGHNWIPNLPTDQVIKLKQAVLDALLDGRAGFATDACALAGLNYGNFWDWRQNDPEFEIQWRNALEVVRERRLDFAESKLLENIGKNDNTAITFFLKTQGKLRNYNDRVDHTIEAPHAIDLDEAARRIAFAMNAAILSGRTMEGVYTEVLTVPTMADERNKLLVHAREAGAVKRVGLGISEVAKGNLKEVRRKPKPPRKGGRKVY